MLASRCSVEVVHVRCFFPPSRMFKVTTPTFVKRQCSETEGESAGTLETFEYTVCIPTCMHHVGCFVWYQSVHVCNCACGTAWYAAYMNISILYKLAIPASTSGLCHPIWFSSSREETLVVTMLTSFHSPDEADLGSPDNSPPLDRDREFTTEEALFLKKNFESLEKSDGSFLQVPNPRLSISAKFLERNMQWVKILRLVAIIVIGCACVLLGLSNCCVCVCVCVHFWMNKCLTRILAWFYTWVVGDHFFQSVVIIWATYLVSTVEPLYKDTS